MDKYESKYFTVGCWFDIRCNYWINIIFIYGSFVEKNDETVMTITSSISITKPITSTSTLISTSIITSIETVFLTKTIVKSQEFIIQSPSFGDNENIPVKYICDGQNISPELVWSTPPEGTEFIVLIMDDPDAPKSFTH